MSSGPNQVVDFISSLRVIILLEGYRTRQSTWIVGGFLQVVSSVAVFDVFPRRLSTAFTRIVATATRGIGVLLFLAVAAALAAGGSGKAIERELAGFPASFADGAKFVGSEKCGTCHVDHYRQQASHHMALTGSAVTSRTREKWFSRGRLRKSVDWPSGSGEAPRYLSGTDGVYLAAPAGAGQLQKVTVAAVMGSGVRGFTPIAAEEEKTIRELRLSFSAGKDSWFMTPGSEGDPDALGTPKSAEQSRGCLECHGTLLAWRDQWLDLGESVLGVHCERCHGPGSAHLEAAGDRANDPKIFNPAALRADEEVKFCGQCHRRPSDMEPFDIMRRAPILSRHAAASLMLSACYRKSPPEKTVTCVECHDPHRNIEPARDPFQKSCLRCHASPEREHWSKPVTSSSDCISCHMPVEDRGFHGVKFTDHWIRVPGAPPPLDAPEREEYLRYLEESYREASREPAAQRVGEGPQPSSPGGGAPGHAGNAAPTQRETDLGPEKKAKLRINLGEVLYARGELESAFQSLREGLSFSPSYAERLRAGALFRQSGRWADTIEILEDAIRAEPRYARAYYDQGEALQAQGKLEEARLRYREALEREPRFARAHNSLGTVLGSQGNLEGAIAHFRKAVELKPDYAEAYNNLGLALRLAGRLSDALAAFKEAGRLQPDWPAALNGMARILAAHPEATERDPAQAVRLAERAAVLTRYENPSILDTLAMAYAAAGGFERAVAVAEEAAKIASAAPAEALAEEIRGRLQLYRENRPYMDSRREP